MDSNCQPLQFHETDNLSSFMTSFQYFGAFGPQTDKLSSFMFYQYSETAKLVIFGSKTAGPGIFIYLNCYPWQMFGHFSEKSFSSNSFDPTSLPFLCPDQDQLTRVYMICLLVYIPPPSTWLVSFSK